MRGARRLHAQLRSELEQRSAEMTRNDRRLRASCVGTGNLSPETRPRTFDPAGDTSLQSFSDRLDSPRSDVTPRSWWERVRQIGNVFVADDLRDGSAEPTQCGVGVCSTARAEADRCSGDRVVQVHAAASWRCWCSCWVDAKGPSAGPPARDPAEAVRMAAPRDRMAEAPEAVRMVAPCSPPSCPVPPMTC